MTDQCAVPVHSSRESGAGTVAAPAGAAEARAAAAAFVAELSPPPSPSTVQDLLLLCSELVTNAVRHAGAVTALSFEADRRSLHVKVADPSPAHPRARVPDLTGATGGFGWPLILRLARKVAVHSQGNQGKIILATMAR